MGEVVLQTQWGWQIAVYLFLGGLAAGTLFVSGLIEVKRPGAFAKTICIAAWAAVVSIAVGLLMLLADVSMPLRALMLWQSFSHLGSWMAVGAWLLFFGIIAAGVLAIAATVALKKPEAGIAKAVRPLSYAAMVFGVCIAAYTGILLSVLVAHPLWNSALLPVLFTVSAFDTGIALVAAIVALAEKGNDAASGLLAKLERWTCILVAAEVVVLAALLVIVGVDGETGAASVHLLVAGALAVPFWLVFVVVGLLVPGAIAFSAMRKTAKPEDDAAESGKDAAPKHGLGLAGNICCLIGGCALRFLILFAGLPVWM